MKNLFEYFEMLEPQAWDYYATRDKQNTQESLSQKFNWNNVEDHSEFIKEYLKIAGKQEVIQKFKIKNIPFNFERYAHTNSVFFLGCVLYKALNLKEKIEFYREDGHDEFFFIWFLSSLVHDFGYQIENCSIKTNDLSKKVTNDIESFKSFFGIENDLLSAQYSLEPNTKILLDNVPAYFEARKNGKISRDKSKKIDHGIAAGLLLFDSLVKNRVEREKKKVHDGLYWGKELEIFYAIASSSIATHNMRRGTSEAGLRDLNINGDNGHVTKLSIDRDPFAFLFALSDTLEPLKIYDSCFNNKTILESICISIEENEIIFENINTGLNFELFIKNAESLQSWADVLIQKCEHSNKIKLIFVDSK